MSHTLPDLPYDYSALEPHIDARTMEIHHTKHHQAYVNNLNGALEGASDLAGKSIGELLAGINTVPAKIRQAVINNGGGHANHTLFWQVMGPGKGGEPAGALAEAMGSTFGGFEQLKEKLNQAGMTRFGSGWAWLVVNGGGLEVYSTANQDSPIMQGHVPILGVDVWEHAYYLNYQNRRADYLAAWWNVVDWDKVAELYGAAKG